MLTYYLCMGLVFILTEDTSRVIFEQSLFIVIQNMNFFYGNIYANIYSRMLFKYMQVISFKYSFTENSKKYFTNRIQEEKLQRIQGNFITYK